MNTLFSMRSAVAIASAVAILGTSPLVYASSHREAPAISTDPIADITDVYAFRDVNDDTKVNFISCFNPFEHPTGGPNYYGFGDDVRYEYHIDNNGDAVEDITYRFNFTTDATNTNSFLYNTGDITTNTDTDLRVSQSYELSKVTGAVGPSESVSSLAAGLSIPPVNIGSPSIADYQSLVDSAVHTLGAIKVYAGPADDPFFVDLNVFNLLGLRDPGVDSLEGYNVHCVAIQDDIASVQNSNGDPVIGVWSTTSRQSVKTLATDGSGTSVMSGDWVQVSRLGSPLVNEVVIPRDNKDKFNASKPANDVSNFGGFGLEPELGVLLEAVAGLQVPLVDESNSFAYTGKRTDLLAIFFTGITLGDDTVLTSPTNPALSVASEQLRINLSIPVSTTPSALGVLGGDLQGFPNGRRLADDVTDIALRAVAGAVANTASAKADAAFGGPIDASTFDESTAAALGDSVGSNDKVFRTQFPYLALPHDGVSAKPQGDAYDETNTGVLIDAIRTTTSTARADNTYVNGLEYEFDLTILDETQSNVQFKFGNYTTTGGVFSSANNVQYFLSGGTDYKNITALDTFGDIIDVSSVDTDTSTNGRQVTIVVQVKVPTGSPEGSYTTDYTVRATR